jgi:hypothetical protein
LSSICTNGISCIDNCPSILFEHKDWIASIPEALPELWKRNSIVDLFEFIYLFESITDVFFIRVNIYQSFLFIKRIKVMWKFQSA